MFWRRVGFFFSLNSALRPASHCNMKFGRHVCQELTTKKKKVSRKFFVSIVFHSLEIKSKSVSLKTPVSDPKRRKHAFMNVGDFCDTPTPPSDVTPPSTGMF